MPTSRPFRRPSSAVWASGISKNSRDGAFRVGACRRPVLTRQRAGGRALLQHPSEFSKLLAEPNLVRSTVEEVLRYDAPVMQGTRIAMLFKRFPKLRLRTDRALARRMTLNFNGLEALWVCADQ
jgi:cytochrome P450